MRQGNVDSKAYLAAALPYIEGELMARQQNVINRAFATLNAGQLTDARAKELWIELSVIHGLQRSLSADVKVQAAQAAKVINTDREGHANG